jgi:predicted house-cleaning noncanonical NTP pyrophosphatase (MazG superfamily)
MISITEESRMNFNKLVRDKLPDLIGERGSKPITQTLGPDAYKRELLRKLGEEVAEFCESGQIEELADILEVIYALAAVEGVRHFNLEEIRQRKLAERGGFAQRILLIEVRE